MSIIKDADYVKMNYKNSENTYENLTPTALANKVNYNQNDLYYAPLGGNVFRNNLESTNVADAIIEIEHRVAQCGRKFDELEFGVGKDIDLLDGAGHQITLDTYYIGNIVYLPLTQKYYMLLYSFTYSRSVLLQSDDGLSWNINSESTDIICIDMKCNSRYLCFIGYETNYDGGYRKGLFFTNINRITDILNNIHGIDNFGVMGSMPSNQYDLSQHFYVSFDMDEVSILTVSLHENNDDTILRFWHILYEGTPNPLSSRVLPPASGFPKILNINPGQYIYYMKGSKVQPKLMSLTKDDKVLIQDFPVSNIYDVLLVDEFGCATEYNNIYVRADQPTYIASVLRDVLIVNPIKIGLLSPKEYAPPLLLAKRCCNNYISYTDKFRFQNRNKKWAYNNNYLEYTNSAAVSLNDNIGDNCVIATGFNPSFINKINDKLFIYTNNEVNSTTLNNSKLYISQIKI